MTNPIGWNFDNSYARLPEKYFTRFKPDPVQTPSFVVLNTVLADSLGLDKSILERNVAIFSGNEIPQGADPIAQAYAGHQFGYFTKLGDGRAILIGEHITPSGQRVDIQLKGSGRTPYSRGGDGRATLGPMLREYIISEAMNSLGIPTTRSLAVVTTGENVMREKPLPGAILTRVAASHIRVGTFQYAARWGTDDELRALADYTIKRHFPEIEAADNPYLTLLQEVIKRQAILIAKWQLVGFIHGVMNTDNMTISGETIDYGPCAFMDTYNPDTVFSSIDTEGRYAYGNQPKIGAWNLAAFADALIPLIHEMEEEAIEMAKHALFDFTRQYEANWKSGMKAKLGLTVAEEEDDSLIKNLLNMMEKYQADYTNTFCALTLNRPEDTGMFDKEEFQKWFKQWKKRLVKEQTNPEKIAELLRKNNPAIIARNHRVEEAIEAAVENNNFAVMEKLNDVLSQPYAYSKKQVEYAKLPKPSVRPYQTFCGT